MGLRLTLNQLPDGGEGSIPSRLTKEKGDQHQMTILLFSVSLTLVVINLILLFLWRRRTNAVYTWIAQLASELLQTNSRIDALPDGKRMRYLSESLDAAIKQCGELDEIKRRLEELESDTAGGNAALDQMFLAGINGIMNYGMKDAVKRG